jgi:hypothetical protein
MEMKRKPRTLEAEVRRLRAGIVNTGPTGDPRVSEMVRVVSAASQAWGDQLERVDRFSLPPLQSDPPNEERASATTTSRFFLDQLASDYRQVASPELDLREVEAERNSKNGARALRRAHVLNRPVAPLAVGQYLAFYERAADRNLVSVLEPWIFSPWIFSEESADLESPYAAAFGIVLGPLVQEALDKSQDQTSMALPGWAGHVGHLWCEEFLAAGAEILRHPELLSPSLIEEQWDVTSRRQGDVTSRHRSTETINQVVELAQRVFGRVDDARVSGTWNRPKIDLVLSGDARRGPEVDVFMGSVREIPADVTILPAISGEPSLTADAKVVQPEEPEP